MAPEGWRVVKLGDVMTATVGGGTPDRSNVDYWGGSIPWATVKDFGPRVLVDTQEHITEKGLRNSASNLVPTNAVVVATRMNVGAVFRSGIPIAINQDLRALLPAQTLSEEYLFYFLQANGNALSRIATGTTVKGLRVNSLRSLSLQLPPLSEQRKIAAILSSVDDAIEKTQAVIDQVRVVKRGLMQELLTRGLPGWHTRFKQTEIGEIPEEWDVRALSDLCDRMFVGIAQAATHAYSERGIPIVRTTNVRENNLNARNLLFITDEFAREMDRKSLRGDDVLTARTGYPGTSVVVPESLEGAQCFTLLVSRPGPRLRSRYLCHTMNSDHGRRIVNRGQAGGAQQNLNVSVFKKARLGVPPPEEQDAICNVLDACYALLDREEAWKGALLDTKSSLMSVLLSGEVRVNPDTEAA